MTAGRAAALGPLTVVAAEPAPPSIARDPRIAAIRQLDLPRPLQPAVHFDPRLPGVEYPSQANQLRLATRSIPTLPASDADIAFASVTDQSHWLRTGQISSLRLTDIYLARIARFAPKAKCLRWREYWRPVWACNRVVLPLADQDRLS